MSEWRVIQGDSAEVLQELGDCSVDGVFTDPPYALVSGGHGKGKKATHGFMGKKWDAALPDPAIWRECLRVLKPGATCCVMSGPRLDCLWRVCRDLEEAGLELQQTALLHIFRSGFPKGQDFSKMADQRAGAEREQTGTGINGRPIVSIAGENTRPYQEALKRDDGSIEYPRFESPASNPPPRPSPPPSPASSRGVK